MDGVNTPLRSEPYEINLLRMKMKPKLDLTFGRLIMSARQTWRAGQGARMLQLMIKSRLLEFRKPVPCLIASPKETSI